MKASLVVLLLLIGQLFALPSYLDQTANDDGNGNDNDGDDASSDGDNSGDNSADSGDYDGDDGTDADADDQNARKRRDASDQCCGLPMNTIDPSTHTACKSSSNNYKGDIPVDKDVVLNIQNNCRATVTPPPANMKPLNWDSTLACVATKWSQQCSTDHDTYDQRVQISAFPIGVGQNLAYAQGYGIPEINQAWCDERNNWVYGSGAVDKTQPVGHFTQMVWENTTSVGCGASQCSDGQIYFVCNYGPAGNVASDSTSPNKPYTPAAGSVAN